MVTPKASIILFALAAALGAVGQYFYKSGADRTTREITSYLLNWRLLAGVLGYGAVMVCFVVALKQGGSIAVLYPIYATTFIWAAVIRWLAYGAQIKPVNIDNMALRLSGMHLMRK